MDIYDVRTIVHSALFSLTTGIVIALWLAKGNTVTLSHLRLAASSITMFGLWVFFLALSVRSNSFLNRDQIVPLLVATEAGGTFLGWAWFLLMLRATFTIERKDDTWLII